MAKVNDSLRARVLSFFRVQPSGQPAGLADLVADVGPDELKVLVPNDEADNIATREEKLARPDVPKAANERRAYGRTVALQDALEALKAAGEVKPKKMEPSGLGYVFAGERPEPAPAAKGGKVTRVPIDQIVIDDSIQQRADGLDEQTVTEYAAVADQLPPVRVFKDSAGKMRLSRGFHRVAAWQRAGWTMVPVEVYEGDRDDAILDAAGDNASHGRRRTMKDVERAISTLLTMRKYKNASTTWIAETVQCAYATAKKYIDRWRKAQGEDGPREVKGRDGRTFKATKGRKKATKDAPPAPEVAKSRPVTDVKDKVGGDVPADDNVYRAFTDARYPMALAAMYDNVRYLREFRGDGFTPTALSVKEQEEALARIERELDTLRLSAPYAVCPEKPGPDFKAAARRGWMTEAEYRAWTKAAAKEKKSAKDKPAPSTEPAAAPAAAPTPQDGAPANAA